MLRAVSETSAASGKRAVVTIRIVHVVVESNRMTVIG